MKAPGRTGPDGATGIDRIAALLGAAWVVLGLVLLVAGGDLTARGLLTGLAAILGPGAVLGTAALLLRRQDESRAELRRLAATVEALQVPDRRERAPAAAAGEVERRLAEIAHAAKTTQAAMAALVSGRSGTPLAAPPRAARPAGPQKTRQNGRPAEAPQPEADIRGGEAQASLALGAAAAQVEPLARPLFVRALNFPDHDGDAEGFAALRTALSDRKGRQLIQSAQDVLTLLSQDGIYVDDLAADRARPEIWRRFARGERGRAVAQLGGIHDRTAIAMVAARMREDLIFRDTAHHFLRHFDRMLVEFEDGAEDAELAQLATTRTARAFMLIGRATGAFD
ncbi:hypothetical protein [Wenxinia saemankumensis]|uniref:Uncharacterized protein n=1 Tax=Wenxinia saemankumensis TaxID=1447782 RepID=A0A1M6E9G0_9RHOB|nr:hypothetical protein [Wenxinia saemankumensis]SHI81990.1 hypothetical protein SAMN05444417_1879 [Wenxinia saemankumensis]